jgi:hypothetical protein
VELQILIGIVLVVEMQFEVVLVVEMQFEVELVVVVVAVETIDPEL